MRDWSRQKGRRGRRALGFLLLLLGVAEPAMAARRADLFVSPQGADTWSGTLAEPNGEKTDGPFATPQRALRASRERKAAGLPSPRIELRDGTYFLDKALELDAADSGTAAHSLEFAAYPGEHPVLDGGLRLPNAWRKLPDGPLWSLELPEGSRPVEDLFIDGRRQPRARMPDSGFWRALPVGESRKQFRFAPGLLQPWPDAANGVVVIKSRQWFDETLPIQSIDGAARTVTVARESQWSLAGDGLGPAGDYYIENVRAALDRPGEWCFDPARRVLLLWPPEGADLRRAVVCAGGLPVLISVRGDMAKKRWAEHLLFDGLALVHTGRSENGPSGAALCLTGGVRDCVVSGGSFADLGGGGVVLWKECEDNLVSGNEFVRVGTTPVRISDYLGEGPPASSGNRVENNSIHDCGTVVRAVSGIELENTGGNRIAHNLLFNLPYCGITLNGDRPQYWNQAASPGLSPPFTAAGIKPFIPSRGNVVEFNHIHDVMRDLGDGGGIYLWGVMGTGANLIRHNLVEHVGAGRGAYVGIYLDDECDDARVTDNVVVDANYGLQLHGAPRNVVENNLFAFSRHSDLFVQPEKYNVAPMGTVLRGNIFLDSADSPFLDTSWAAWDRLPLRECDDNLYWRDGAPVPLGQGVFGGFDRHSRVADPKCEAPRRGDFRLQADSPARALGIHSIDVRGAGPMPAPFSETR